MEAVKASRFGRCAIRKHPHFLLLKCIEGFKHKTNGVMYLVQALSTEKKNQARNSILFGMRQNVKESNRKKN